MATAAPSIPDALRALFASVVALGRTRLELFGIEFAEQKANALRISVLAAIGLVCLAMAAMVFTAFVAVMFWDTEYRLLAVGLTGLVWLLAGVFCLVAASRHVKHAKHPFAMTLAELERDYDVLTSPMADPSAAPVQRQGVRTSTSPDPAPAAVNPVDPGNPS